MLEARQLTKHYPVKKFMRKIGTVKALNGVSFELKEKETLAVVGESGCGKSTLARLLMHVEDPTSGDIVFDGKPMTEIDPQEYRRKIQMIFQNPYGALNPRKRAWKIVAEPLEINGGYSRKEMKESAKKMLLKVGLRPETAERYPHMFSGGQRQRIGIARALMLNPQVILCDEPVSCLDVSVQAQILNLLMDLQQEMGLSYLFISHDLSVVRHIADKVMVVYLGRVVEYGDRDAIFKNPKHPYTKALLASSPNLGMLGKRAEDIPTGELPSPLKPPKGCPYHSRCPVAEPRCDTELPPLEKRDGRQVACFVR